MYKYTIFLSVSTIPLAVLGIFFAGGGHGNYFLLLLLFPFSLLGTLFNEGISFIFIIIGLLQLPIYGFLLDRFTVKKAFPIIIGIHIIFMIFLFLLKRDELF
ncbi:hypothetical protein [Chryseobacterium luteum]|uniref:Major facilitator superfamily (MFS) profile domain-containing protein n=1 Tax=Chryseobacterium luteum TaxID=421531 RepID=A0A085ZGL7_9FLAO|nr:hypothetical protein [Chryseobacterium luteum]KFF03581.1 hypothetical protein IX38_11460 [Chryseobacterium luteum]